MTRFVDKYLSSRIQGYPVEIAPLFSTEITEVDSGSEQANQRWFDPKREISIPQGFREQATVNALTKHWLVMRGPARTWPWRDPMDFASVDVEEPNEATADILARIAATDQPLIDADGNIAVPDGVETTFYLGKVYDIGSPAEPYMRRIYFPIVSSLQFAIDGTPIGDLSPALTVSVAREGGAVTFSDPPPAGSPGTSLTWGGLFDIQVRFSDDDAMRQMFRTAKVGGFADIPLREVPFCED